MRLSRAAPITSHDRTAQPALSMQDLAESETLSFTFASCGKLPGLPGIVALPGECLALTGSLQGVQRLHLRSLQASS